MEQEKNGKSKMILVIAIILILVILAALFFTDTISLKIKNNNDSNNQVTATQVKSFLISNKLISMQDAVGSNMPDGYAFLDNGKFAYYDQDFYRQFTESKENRLISFIGTYEILDNKLTLHIAKEEYAVGGKISDGPPYPVLNDFTKEVKNVDKTIEYTINKFDDASEYMPFISLMQNDDETKWYGLSVDPTYVETIHLLAENGYSDSNTINDNDINLFDYKTVPIEEGFTEIKLTSEEKKKIDQELTNELWPGETSSLLSSVNFKEINKNYYEDDCNKEYFSWWYIFKNKKVEQKYSHLLIEHYYEKYDTTISMIKYDDFVDITRKMFNVTKLECDNSNLYETTIIDNQKYVINSLAGGGGVCWGIKVLNKYQKDNVYYYLIHYHRGNYSLCGCDCSDVDSDKLLSGDSRFFKFKYGVRDDNSKYIISLEYLN